MTMTLEEAAEKVLRAAGFRPQDMPQDKDSTDPILSALKAYGDQRFIEGATAMREMAAEAARDPYSFILGYEEAILALDPAQLKDTDHG